MATRTGERARSHGLEWREVHRAHTRAISSSASPGTSLQKARRGPLRDPRRAARRHRCSRGVYTRFKRLIIGEPLATAAAGHERLTKLKALAVLSSDALSSVAYATEEIMRVLLLAGTAALERVARHRRGAGGAAVRRRLLVSPDDQGVPDGRRQLHRRQGQPGHAAGPDRRGLAADLVHADRGGVGRGRASKRWRRRIPALDGVEHRDRRQRSSC